MCPLLYALLASLMPMHWMAEFGMPCLSSPRPSLGCRTFLCGGFHSLTCMPFQELPLMLYVMKVRGMCWSVHLLNSFTLQVLQWQTCCVRTRIILDQKKSCTSCTGRWTNNWVRNSHWEYHPYISCSSHYSSGHDRWACVSSCKSANPDHDKQILHQICHSKQNFLPGCHRYGQSYL